MHVRDVLTRSKNGLKSLTRNVTESMPTTHITSTSATARSKWLPYQTIMTVSKNTTPTAATRPLEIQRENMLLSGLLMLLVSHGHYIQYWWIGFAKCCALSDQLRRVSGLISSPVLSALWLITSREQQGLKSGYRCQRSYNGWQKPLRRSQIKHQLLVNEHFLNGTSVPTRKAIQCHENMLEKDKQIRNASHNFAGYYNFSIMTVFIF